MQGTKRASGVSKLIDERVSKQNRHQPCMLPSWIQLVNITKAELTHAKKDTQLPVPDLSMAMQAIQ